MPTKRSRAGRAKHLRRFARYLQRCREEMREVWYCAIWDHDKQEVTNVYPCEYNPIHQGEVLLDSRNQGFLQRLT